MKNYFKFTIIPLATIMLCSCSGSNSSNGSTSSAPTAGTQEAVNMLNVIAGIPGGLGTPTTGLAINSNLGEIKQIALDTHGNLYLADRYNSLIEKIDTQGKLSVVAGVIGKRGAPTNNVPAVQSTLNYPQGVAVDKLGNLYIADSDNRVVEKVDTSGILTIIAGRVGQQGIPTPGAATSTSLKAPNSVAVDESGNVYIADTNNSLIEKVNTEGVLSIFAGVAGQAGAPTAGAATSSKLNLPYSITTDESGNVYIADTNNALIEKVDSQGNLSIFAGIPGQVGMPTNNESATNSKLGFIQGVAFATINNTGHLFIADGSNNLIESINVDTKNLNITAGDGQLGIPANGGAVANATSIYIPYGIAASSSGNVYYATGGATVESINNGMIHYMAGKYTNYGLPTVGLATQSKLNNPYNVAVDKQGNLYVADVNNSLVEKITPEGQLSILAGKIGEAGAVQPGPATGTVLSLPCSIAVDESGNIFIGDGSFYVLKINKDGILSIIAGNGTFGAPTPNVPATQSAIGAPNGIATDKAGNIYLADLDQSVVEKINATTGVLTIVAGIPGETGVPVNNALATNSRFNGIAGVAIDESGNIYIADSGNQLIEKVTTDGKVHIIAGIAGEPGMAKPGVATQSRFRYPNQLALDKSGNLYIADTLNSLIEKIDTNGNLSIVAGIIDRFGSPINNTPAEQNLLLHPYGVAVDESGNVYIADSENNSIDKITVVKK